MKDNQKKGFTLIELLIVVAIGAVVWNTSFQPEPTTITQTREITKTATKTATVTAEATRDYGTNLLSPSPAVPDVPSGKKDGTLIIGWNDSGVLKILNLTRSPSSNCQSISWFSAPVLRSRRTQVTCSPVDSQFAIGMASFHSIGGTKRVSASIVSTIDGFNPCTRTVVSISWSGVLSKCGRN